MVKTFCAYYSSEYTFVKDKGVLCAVRTSDGAYELYDKKHIDELKSHHMYYSCTCTPWNPCTVWNV